MRPLTLTLSKARELDKRAEKDYGIPSLILMENAGRGLADHIQRSLIVPIESCRLVFVCGTGNNAGDAFVAIRHLYQRKILPNRIFIVGEPSKMKSDAAINYRIIKSLGLPIEPFSQFSHAKKEWDRRPVLIIDAILGTGFKPPLREEAEEAIKVINELKKWHTSIVKVLAVDIPSGLNGDEGINGSEAIKAEITVTFACYKPGLMQSESKPYVGRLEIVDIGIPDKLIESVNAPKEERK